MARQGLLNCENLRLGLTKWALIIFNVAFWCIGAVSLGLGIWLYITRNEYAVLNDGRYLLGSAFLIAVGFGVIIVGFLGIVAALWESNIVATSFGVMIFLACGLYLTTGIWSMVTLNSINDNTHHDLQRTMNMFKTNAAYANGWNTLQSNLQCCGVMNHSEWRSALFQSASYPLSCCSEPSTCYAPTSSVYTQGCLARLAEYERQQLNMMGPLGLAFGGFQIIGLLISTLFCTTVRRSKASYYT